ncbi:MAG: tryptophan--tRNA ligase [Rickettsiales bacterium]
MMATVFSGIQPTGKLTIGNYLGAMKNWVKMQNEHDQTIFCIVDLHAITMPQDPKALRESCTVNMATYIAAGLDPDKSILFTQSAVSYHAELSWIFGCITPMGWLNRMTQFKDKAGKHKEQAGLGLYAYPVLMAADILLYHATHVPVGDDQTQHLELTRDVAGAFNRSFAVDYFKEPEMIPSEFGARIMSLRDGTKKMSKSDESDFSRINLADDADLIMQKIRKAKTDAITGVNHDPQARPEIANLLNIYCAFAGDTVESAVSRFRDYQTSKFKEEVAQAIIDGLKPMQDNLKVLLSDRTQIHKIAERGAEKASEIALKTIKEVREIVGLTC